MAVKSKLWHIGLLGILTTFVFVVIGRSLIDPNWGKLKAINFPEKISLPEWSEPISNSTAIEYTAVEGEKKKQILGRTYKYSKNSKTLTLEIFSWNTPDGNMYGFFEIYRQKENEKNKVPSMDIKQKSESFFGLYYSQNAAHLTSCINPRGASTITNEQFRHNRSLYDLNPNRWLGVLLGTARLREWKCLWVNLSIPCSLKDVDKCYTILTTAWLQVDSNRKQYFPDFVDSDSNNQ